jgi:hypothetical protein
LASGTARGICGEGQSLAKVLSMTAMTFKKGIAALCCLLGIALGLVGAYYLWSAPIDLGKQGVELMLVAFVLHVVFWILWP